MINHYEIEQQARERAQQKVRVIVRLELPYSEVCMHLGVAGQTRDVEVLEHGAQILSEDGHNFSFPIGHGEAGVAAIAAAIY